MESKARVKTEGQKKGPGGRVSTKLRGGGYADPKAAAEKTNKRTKSNPSEKVKGGGYGDAKEASGKKKTSTERGGPETTKQPF